MDGTRRSHPPAGTYRAGYRRRRRLRLALVLVPVAIALVASLLAVGSATTGRSPASFWSAPPAPATTATTATTGSPAGTPDHPASGPLLLDAAVEFTPVPTGPAPPPAPPPAGTPVGDGAGTPPDPAEPEQPTPTPTAGPAIAAVPGPTPGPVLAAPGLPVGCAAGCITKAWLTPSLTTTDVDLEVRTDTPARIVVTVGTDPPQGGADGPQIPDPVASESTGPDYRTDWTTTLSGLAPGTGYHIVVSAQDANGGRSTEAGEFTTTEPADGFSAAEPGGCAANCVEIARIAPAPGEPGADLAVTTHVPAAMAVYLDEHAPQTDHAGEPHFPGVAAAASTGGEHRTVWSASLPLAYATTYHVILQVTDDRDRSQFLQASFTTKPEPVASHHNRVLVTFHKIHVSNDADDTFLNRKGELTFRFRVDGERRNRLDTGERKVKSPAWVSLDDGNRSPGRSMVVENAPDLLSLEVQAQERDGSYPGFCSAGIPWFEEVSGRAKLDKCYDLEWNTASGQVDLHPEPEENPALPPCYGFDGISGDICVLLTATGDDPTFDVYVTIDFLE